MTEVNQEPNPEIKREVYELSPEMAEKLQREGIPVDAINGPDIIDFKTRKKGLDQGYMYKVRLIPGGEVENPPALCESELAKFEDSEYEIEEFVTTKLPAAVSRLEITEIAGGVVNLPESLGKKYYVAVKTDYYLMLF